jgi:acyl-coenzyme A thioesterase 13
MSEIIPAGYAPLPGAYSHSFIAHIGPFYVREEADGQLSLAIRVQHQHCNPFGEVHGGFLAAMSDLVCAYTMLRGPDPTPSVTTIQLATQMIASARLGDWLEGRASLRRKGRTIAFMGCDFTVGDTLVAHADAVFRVLSERGVSSRYRRRELLNLDPDPGEQDR